MVVKSTIASVNLRSVESFERKLEETQKALNIDPRDYVPVMYIDETNHARELASLLPTILLIGKPVLLLSRVTCDDFIDVELR